MIKLLGSLLITVVLINAFAYLTIRLRPIIYKTKLFKPMIWNFKLSLLPMGIMIGTLGLGGLVVSIANNGEPYFWLFNVAIAIFLLGIILWLLMLPNSGYLITELNMTHRDTDADLVPIWYDIISVTSFALSGVINTIANIAIIQLLGLLIWDPQIITQKNHIALLVVAVVLNVLVSLGVYLGRQIRFNSWDVLHPIQFVKKLVTHFKGIKFWKDFVLFIVMHTTFFMIVYYALGIHRIFIM